MPQTQVAPAVFLLDERNNPSLVNYRPRGDFIVVERIAPGLLLKLGQEEVRIISREANKSGLWK